MKAIDTKMSCTPEGRLLTSLVRISQPVHEIEIICMYAVHFLLQGSYASNNKLKIRTHCSPTACFIILKYHLFYGIR